MSAGLLEKEKVTQSTDEGDHDLFAHYCRKSDIERSWFDGIEITALCGKKWRPSRDFARYPVCQGCKDILEGLPE